MAALAAARVVDAVDAPRDAAQGKEQEVRYGNSAIKLWCDWDVGIGGELWSCGLLLCEDVESHSADYAGARRVLELGAGTGLAGLFLARACPQATVSLTDLEDHLALLQRNVDLNQLGGRVVAETLDWADASEAQLQGFDIIIATDCAYHARLHAPLVDVLRRCLTASNAAILGVTKSNTAPAFFKMLDAAGLDYTLLRPPKDDYFALLRITKRPGFFGSGNTWPAR
ncbi:putative methyltransferase-domain-containing protein [Pelagophyceae sp. CCMP2097]|nr:putative methyltransferase-domain-containing protein [Pelagophyceae sp. CCMP2097]